MNDKLIFTSNGVEVYDYSEKSYFIVGKRDNIFMQEIYNNRLCMPNMQKIYGKAGYYAAKKNKIQIESILQYNATAAALVKAVEQLEFIATKIELPTLTKIIIELSDLDPDQAAPVMLVISELNQVLKGEMKISDMSWIAITAGPGSGKTHTLIKKILIEAVLPALLPLYPELNVLATTFTKNGIKEIQKKFKKAQYPEMIDYVEISTISSIGYRVLKDKYPNWKFDIEKENITITDVINRDFSKMSSTSPYMKNKHKTKTVMKYLDIETNYQFSIYKKIPNEDYNRYQDIIQKSNGFLIESKEDFLEFLTDEKVTDKRDVKILSLAYTKGFKEFDRAYKTVNNYYYERFYSIAVALAKNENVQYDDIDYLREVLNRHKSDFIKFKEEITETMLENVLLILRTSDIFHTIPFENKFKKNDFYYNYIFDYNDFARIPLLEQLIPEKKYDFFFIDEFQDLTDIQYNYLLYLAEEQGTVCYGIGDNDQAVFYYGGTNHGAAFRKFIQRANVKHFELTYNYRSSRAVCKSYVENSFINKKYTLRPNCIEGVNKKISYEKALDLIDYSFAIVCLTNSEIFDVIIDLIERGKVVYMRGEEFNSKMNPIYTAISNGKETTSGMLSYYKSELKRIEKEVEDEYPDEYKIILETNYEYNNVKRYQTKIKSLLIKFGFIDSKETVKNESVFELLEKIKEFIKFENGDEITDCIQVLTYHECKGSEFDNMLIVNMNKLAEEWRNQTDAESLVNDKLILVACSRARIGNYYTQPKTDKNN